ncbi:MAG TPA: helix-turn-helix domain-containing protein [Candidatus Nanoarchaeia archaeon]|nr:helix-turn-helix domain-containing protein [Candidatus Nanoarchaeia archaeon]
MQETDIKTLELTGLTHAQAIIYLTLLELGQTKVGTIIEKTKLQSSVVHNNINKLIDKGLVSFVMMGQIKHYQVAEPSMFLNYLEEQKQSIDESKKEIQKLLPKLKLIREQAKKKTEVEVYQGRNGFKTAYMEEYEKMAKNETAQFIAQPSEFQQDEQLHEFFLKINQIVEEKKCIIQGIGPKINKTIWEKFYKNQKNYRLKYINDDFPWGVMIFKEQIIISIWGDEPIIIKIKNKKFRDNALNYFNKKWDEART